MTPQTPEVIGLRFAVGTTVPTDTAAGFQTGCLFQKTDGGAETSLYVNEGSVTSCLFQAIAAAASTELSDLSDVGALTYAAGSVLVADGDSYEEVVSVTRTHAIPLTSFHPGGSGLDMVNVMTATPQGDGAELGLAVTAGTPVVGTSTNNSDATEHMGIDFVVPADYKVGEDLTVRISFLMTAAANATSDLDVVAKLVKAGALDSTDICATAAKDLKAVVAAADQDYVITGDASGDELAPGSIVNLAISAQRDDTGGSTAGTVQINAVTVLVPSYR
jgi:hypothetical protein